MGKGQGLLHTGNVSLQNNNIKDFEAANPSFERFST